MGVYMYGSKHGPFIKVGHYAGQNAWSRVAHRGFYSCVCPQEIQDRVSIEDLELLAWFPGMDKSHERLVKKKWKEERIYKKSEWFPLQLKEDIFTFLLQLGFEECKDNCCAQSAQATRKRL